MKVNSFVKISERLAKSANVERDSEKVSFENYVITGRVQDLLRQMAKGMISPKAGRAFSITGPYGTGKSSFAIFLNALFSDTDSSSFQEAIEALEKVDASLAEDWRLGRNSMGAPSSEPLRAFSTAEREPLVWTIAKAVGASIKESALVATDVSKSDLLNPSSGIVDAANLKRLLLTIAKSQPVVILIDEFGKNLQTFGETGAAGDPYLLQELAEASQGVDAAPIILVTMQHLAFDEYVSDMGNLHRREWSKIQGRFHDVGFVESAEQTHHLIASAFERLSADAPQEIHNWYLENRDNIRDVVNPDLAERAYPLHPLAMAALPELCNRYGQNERTLFSFIAGEEPNSLKTLLGSLKIDGVSLPFVGLSALYDYFLSSASSFIAASNSASRWLEIELRLRDYKGQLSEIDETVLKSIAVLNLVSSGGSLRASQSNLVEMAVGPRGNQISEVEVTEALKRLADASIVTYRDFADEWRIWKGSDFDIRSSIETARIRAQGLSTFEMLSGTVSNDWVIAGRSSQQSGILRVFDKIIASQNPSLDDCLPKSGATDGTLVLVLEGSWKLPELPTNHRPIIVGEAGDPKSLRFSAIEVYATASALGEVKARAFDEVAFRELSERLTVAKLSLQSEIETQWSASKSRWLKVINNVPTELEGQRTISELLSTVVDQVYTDSPVISNEMIARRDLTTQGSKARRVLAEAIIRAQHLERLGLHGYGPEVAMYRAILEASGMHRSIDGIWQLTVPSEPKWLNVWEALEQIAAQSEDQRLNLSSVEKVLSTAPFGLKAGLIWLITVVYLQANSQDVALYEYGSIVLNMDDAIVERLLKNPGVFSMRKTGVRLGARRQITEQIAMQFGIPGGAEASFMSVVRVLFKQFQQLPPIAFNLKQGISLQSAAIREAFKSASEPDKLIFVDVPEALGLPSVAVSQKELSAADRKSFVNGLANVILEVQGIYPRLLEDIESRLKAAFDVEGDLSEIRGKLSESSSELDLAASNSLVKTLATAFARQHVTDQEWLANIAMIIAEGLPPRQWVDDSILKFESELKNYSVAWRSTLALAKVGSRTTQRAISFMTSDGSLETRVTDLASVSSGSISKELKALTQKLESSGMTYTEAAVLIAALSLEGNVGG